MRHNVFDPIGVEISDLAVADADADAIVAVRRLLADHGVAVFSGQDVDDAGFVDFLTRFGTLTFTAGETPVVDCPDLNVISNVGRTKPPRSVFHVDTSYVRRPPAYTALRAVEIPESGGETLFTNQFRAFDTLSAELRTTLEGRTVRHVVTGVDPDGVDETAADHPVFRQHPISGRTSLYLSTPERCVAMSGMGIAESEDTIRALYAHSTSANNIYRHSWAPGQIVMWDNRCVMHRGDHSAVVGDRVMHRGMVAADATDLR